jgi:hypothetical protein
MLIEGKFAAGGELPRVRSARERMKEAFRDLRSKNYICKGNFSCCGSCGSGELADAMLAGGKVGYVFWDHQRNDAWAGDELTSELYLLWDTADGDASVIVRALKAAGLKVVHDGLDIEVLPTASVQLIE